MDAPSDASASDLIVHASCVSVRDRAVLIEGASGTGKSALALELMSRGAVLIADDRTCLTRKDDQIIASAPEALKGMIEARGIGILRAQAGPPCPVTIIVDLDHIERARLPHPRSRVCLGRNVTVLHKVETAYFPAAILQYLAFGQWTDK